MEHLGGVLGGLGVGVAFGLHVFFGGDVGVSIGVGSGGGGARNPFMFLGVSFHLGIWSGSPSAISSLTSGLPTGSPVRQGRIPWCSACPVELVKGVRGPLLLFCRSCGRGLGGLGRVDRPLGTRGTIRLCR